MMQSRIYLVVPKRLKVSNETYATALNVISFEDFFKLHLDPSMERWKAKKVPPFV